MRKSRLVTLINAGSENTMTAMSLCRPCRFLMSLRILETRRTRNTRISWGAKEKLEVVDESMKRPISRSITEAKTMNRSNLKIVFKVKGGFCNYLGDFIRENYLVDFISKNYLKDFIRENYLGDFIRENY